MNIHRRNFQPSTQSHKHNRRASIFDEQNTYYNQMDDEYESSSDDEEHEQTRTNQNNSSSNRLKNRNQVKDRFGGQVYASSKAQVSDSYELYKKESIESLSELQQKWAVDVASFNLDFETPLTQHEPSSKPDLVLVSQVWNKILAFRSMFAEALVGRWRILVAADVVLQRQHDHQLDSPLQQLQGFVEKKSKTKNNNHCPLSNFEFTQQSVELEALHLVERNLDPIAKYFGTRVIDLGTLLVAALDLVVNSLCPHQVLQREAYAPLAGSADPDPCISRKFFHEHECKTLGDFFNLFGRYSLPSRYWLIFCDAFLWTMKHQNPYKLEDESEDLDKPKDESAVAQFIAGMFALPILESSLRHALHVRQTVFQEDLKEGCSTAILVNHFNSIGFSQVLDSLFADFPDIADHFSQGQKEEMSLNLFEIIDAIIQTPEQIFVPNSPVRNLLDKMSLKWSKLGMSVDTFALLGKGTLDTMEPLFANHGEYYGPEMEAACAHLIKESFQILLHPTLIYQNLRLESADFYKDVALELNWSSERLKKRMFEVYMEITTTGQYTHTKEEIEVGAKLAWRNSSKCIGRISWNTLVIRDCRNCESPQEIFHETVEHLKLATGGVSIQSVMTVFRPRQINEIWGVRFLSSQIIRYAGYVIDGGNSEILGDPANAELTSYLIAKKLWVPPKVQSAFDVLPLVLKLPGNDVPFLYTLPKEAVHEVHFEHPNYPKAKQLGYKWNAVPAITNMSMNLGGIHFPCCPFNGWFVSTEIARNLLERYKVTDPLAGVFGIDSGDRMLHQKVASELENMILHSFDKNNFTIVDPRSVGKSFMTHCKKERSAGRDCPSQWSWIGGLVGPTNPTWHMEMKDFQKLPQYEYNCETWKVAVFKSGKTIHVGETETDANDALVDVSIPKVLITFGSETGTAETAAHSLARRMQASKPTVQSLNDTAVMDKTAFGSYSHVLIICSTFGAGNSPQNARAFFECDLREKMKETATINFAVLALGSSLYPDFCKAGKRAHELMVLAGATSMMDIVFADAANGSQSEILRWSTIVKKNVLPESLVAQIRLMETSIDAGTFQTVITYQLKWHHGDDSYLDDRSKQSTETTMRCIANEALFDYDTNSARRSTHHIELEVPAETTPYETGDHLSVMPKNSLNMVTQLCECFGHELENAAAKYGFYTLGNDSLKQVKQLSHSLGITPSLCWLIHQPLYIECIENGQSNLHQSDDMTNETLLHVLQEQLDFSFHSLSYFLDLLSMLSSRLDKTISTKASRYFQRMAHDVISRYHDLNDYDKAEDIKAKFPTVVHLLEKMKSLFCEPIGNRTEPLITLGDVLVMMPKLKPRFYSIASSSVTSPRRISLLVGAVNNITKAGIVQEGVCSCYLKQLKQDDYISAKVVESTFRLPVSSYSTPVILVGTGTGLAPFIGFLSERADVMKSCTNRGFGKSHLFFGCRNEAEFIMEDQINEWDQNNVVDAHITYSRSLFKPKNYVQDAIKNHGEELANLILSNANGANVYICGDAHIAKLCSDAFVSLLQEHGKMSKVAAVKYISGMYHTYRWQLDVWGETNAIVEDTSMGLDTSEHVRMEASRHAWQGKFNSSFASNGKGTISE